MVSFKFSTILKHIQLNLHIIIGKLYLEISEIFETWIIFWYIQILNKQKSIKVKKFPAQ